MMWAIAVVVMLAAGVRGAEVKILLLAERAVYQTNEQIDVLVGRTGEKALSAGPMKVSLVAEDGGRVEMVFAVKGGEARMAEQVRLNGWLLRPGKYAVEVAADGAKAQAAFEVYSHVRMSSFKLVHRGSRPKGAEQALLGERGLGFNMIFGEEADWDAIIRGGLDAARSALGPFDSVVSEPANQYRLDQFEYITRLMLASAVPSEFPVHRPFETEAAEGIVETNRLMGRLGTIFTTMPVDRGQVAMLWAGPKAQQKTTLAYLAGKIIHIQLFPIAEVDVQDGTLAAQHKVTLLAGIDELDAKVIAGLEAYIDGGGVVLVSDESKVKIKGATPLGYAIAGNDAAPLAKALKAKLDAMEIRPVMDVDSAGIITSRQAWGDIEYLFAVNATEGLKSAEATLSLAADERILYDAIHGRLAKEFVEKEGKLTAKIRFGPGQMRVFARTNKTIGGVDLPNPMLVRDFTKAEAPVRLDIVATVVDSHNAILAGSVPMHIQVIDPLRMIRYEMYRATEQGVLKLSLPLAANDPAGQWRIIVRELLSGTQGTNSFAYEPGKQCGAVGGVYAVALDTTSSLERPVTAAVMSASKSTARGPEAKIAWRAVLPDRAVSMEVNDKGGLTIATNDGSQVQLDAGGQIVTQALIAAAPAKLTPPKVPNVLADKLHPWRIVKFIETKDDRLAVAYWGGTVEVFDGKGVVKNSQLLPHDVAGMKWLGNRLVVAQSDASVVALAVGR
jgi:hypothetical protein